jgi:[ribosomal protein S5]-alanine N-acetyltransferase
MFTVLSDLAIYEFENKPPESVAWLTARFTRLEARKSNDGSELWLNWVVRLPTGELAGFVQATVRPAEQMSFIAYELASHFWRRGLGRGAVSAMMAELGGHYEVNTFVAVLKCANYRSKALLENLGFTEGTSAQRAVYCDEPDECVMLKKL